MLFSDAFALIGEPELTKAARHAARTIAGHVANLIRRGQADGGIRADLDPEPVAWLLLSVLSTRAFRTVITPDHDRVKGRRHRARLRRSGLACSSCSPCSSLDCSGLACSGWLAGWAEPALAGMTISNVAPWPLVLRTRTEPWWASAMACTMGRPSPNPPASRLRYGSARVKRAKMWPRSSGGMPQPESATAMTAFRPRDRR